MAFDWKPPKKPGAMAMTSTSQCKSCGGTDFDDFCESGDRACSQCGTVLQENGIVSTVQFSESGGSSNVVGQFVSGDKGRPGGGGGARGRGRFGYSRDSRDITIQNGKKKIMQAPRRTQTWSEGQEGVNENGDGNEDGGERGDTRWG